MKSAIILTIDGHVANAISAKARAAGFKGNIEVLRTDMELLERIGELEHLSPAAVFIDLTALDDGIRLVQWLRLSPRMRRLRVVAIGEEGEALSIFRNAWGAQTVLIKPLCMAAMKEVVATLDLAGTPTPSKLRSEARRKLVAAVERSKKLREEQETHLRHVDLLMAELKEKKMPFKRREHAGPGEGAEAKESA